MYKFNFNSHLLFKPASELPHSKFYNLINKEHISSLRLVNVMDLGFYYRYRIVPQYKYFCSYNFKGSYTELSDIDRRNDSHYVIVPKKYDFKNYNLIGREYIDYYSHPVTLYLYEKKVS